MTFSLTLKIVHPGIKDPITHIDTVQAKSIAAALKLFNLPAKQKCELKNSGRTKWQDGLGALHTLTLTHEAN